MNEDTNDRLHTLSARVEYDFDLSAKRTEVSRLLGKVHGLTKKQKFVSCDILVRGPKRLDLFKMLGEEMLDYVMHILEEANRAEGLITRTHPSLATCFVDPNSGKCIISSTSATNQDPTQEKQRDQANLAAHEGKTKEECTEAREIPRSRFSSPATLQHTMPDDLNTSDGDNAPPEYSVQDIGQMVFDLTVRVANDEKKIQSNRFAQESFERKQTALNLSIEDH
ncbi:hypothetical protein SASPL_145393 [Salvia splendens]|uniref:Uncharacterized protein n=1 Tax=Salvia splendens TaxID=180675 RepID=A0A8X8WIE9_SALSN|nr:hypothetical protein SASPL_145393 [Salvia splendens]